MRSIQEDKMNSVDAMKVAIESNGIGSSNSIDAAAAAAAAPASSASHSFNLQMKPAHLSTQNPVSRRRSSTMQPRTTEQLT